MTPRIITLDRVVLLGFNFYGDPFTQSSGWTEENEIGRLWQRFMEYWEKEGKHLPYLNDRYWYEVHTHTPETVAKGFFDVFVGVEVSEISGVPQGPLYRALPDGEYAIFTLKGSVITSDWGYPLENQWLPQAKLKQSHPISIQRYDERFKGMDRIEESELDILIPVIREDA